MDNLKLGYGGTKEEMSRLLADASELAGKEFEMGNFADIIEAIHVIQENMGITGTTAEEASGTINGSILAWKSALDNLLTGIGRNENIDQLVDNLVDSTEDVIANLIPAIRRASEGFMQVIRVAVVRIGPQVMDAFRDIWNNKLPGILTSAANGIIGLINDIFGTNIPKIETIELPSWGDISAKVILWAETVRNRIRTITKWTIGIFTAPTETATEMTTTFTRWWEETAKPTILSISTWALNLFGLPGADENTITSHVQRWWKGIVGWVQNACVWTLQMFGFAPDAATNAVDKISEWFGGVVDLLSDTLTLVFNWASGMDAQSIANDAKKLFDDAKTLLGNTMQIVWNLIPPKLQETIGGLIESLQTFWNENKEGVMGLFDPENSVIVSFISGISDMLSDPEFGATLVEAVETFLGAIKMIADALFTEAGKATIAGLLELLVSVLNLIEPLLALIAPLLQLIAPALQIAAGIVNTAAEAFQMTLDFLADPEGYTRRMINGPEYPIEDMMITDGPLEGLRIPLSEEQKQMLESGIPIEDVISYTPPKPTPAGTEEDFYERIASLRSADVPSFLWGGEGAGLPESILDNLESLAAYGIINTLSQTQVGKKLLSVPLPVEPGGGKPTSTTDDVVTELETVKTEIQGLRNDLMAAVQSLMNRPISIDGQIITSIIGQGIMRKARTTFG